VTPAAETAWTADQVKPLLLASFSELLDSTFAAEPATGREAEEGVWRVLLGIRPNFDVARREPA
jgi:hypothetical protein